MKKPGLILIILLLAFLQANILDSFRLFSFKPDLLLGVSVFAVLNTCGYWPFIFALLCGLLKDSLSYAAFGLNIFSFCLISVTVTILNKGMYFDSQSNYIPIVFACALFNSLVNYAYLFRQLSLPAFLSVSFVSAVYTTIAAVLIFKFLRGFSVNPS
ncbi:MAG: rod shape-determining protein MreD [Candidatus Omnitrophica bacterium]|nr:rod shape-determining protein MreD [Candidatus Omnitrophota bacterium]